MKITKIFFITLLSALFSVTAVSCSDKAIEQYYNSDWEYLSIPNEFDFMFLNKEYESIILQAISRLEIKENEDGLLVLETTSAKEINVSNNIFNYAKKIIENNNLYDINGNLYSRRKLLTRSQDDTNDGFCLAQAITDICPSIKYNDVKEYIYSQYQNNGVPAEDISKVLDHFNLRHSETNPNDIKHGTHFKNGAILIYYVGTYSNNGEWIREMHAVGSFGVTINGTVYFYNGALGDSRTESRKQIDGFDSVYILN